MAERDNLTLDVLAERRKVAALRALLGRIEQNRLEGDDQAVVKALIVEVIEQAEPGQEWVTIEVAEQEEEAVAGGPAERSESSARGPEVRRHAPRPAESAASHR